MPTWRNGSCSIHTVFEYFKWICGLLHHGLERGYVKYLYYGEFGGVGLCAYEYHGDTFVRWAICEHAFSLLLKSPNTRWRFEP